MLYAGKKFPILATFLGLMLVMWSAELAFAQSPLLIEGKSTLYQRVLTRPDAKLFEDEAMANEIASLQAFEIFYVYDRQSDGQQTRLKVGRSLQIGPEGWMNEASTIAWKQTIVMGFTNPANRERALLFSSKEALEETLSGEDVVARLDQLRRDAIAGQTSEISPVVSIEPAEHIDIEREFYILPILESQNIRLPNRLPSNLLRVASVSQRASGSAESEMSREDALRDFRIGVTFVIDTTRSMQPYVEQVRQVMTRLQDRIGNNPEAERFRFGLVGFRDNIDLAPELDYVTNVFLPLGPDATAARFVETIGQVDVATVNSNGFNEDAIAGIDAALNQMDWTPYGGKFIVLITDASPREPGEYAQSGGLGVSELQIELEKEGIALMAMHLRSEAGRFDHQVAEDAYRQLSRFDNSVHYFPIADASPQEFGNQMDLLAQALEDMVGRAMSGEIQENQAEPTTAIADATSRAGRAMQLAYLGRLQGTQAPDVFEGWLTDRDPVDRRGFPVTPYLLMSRNELSALRDVMDEAVSIGASSIQEDASDDFFNRLRQAVALMTRRADAVEDAGTLGDLLGEYLDGLPYNSEIVSLTEDDWRDMSPTRERQLIDSLRSRIVALDRIHDDGTRWIPIKDDAPAGEHVTVVPLRLLP